MSRTKYCLPCAIPKAEPKVKEWQRPGGSDLVCQFGDALPSVVQHVAHTEDRAERVLLRMVVTTLDLVPSHGGGEVPSEQSRAAERRGGGVKLK